MSKRGRDGDRGRDDRGRDGDRSRDGDRGRDRRDGQPDDDQQRRTGEDAQEGDSLTALKAILSKVANLLNPLQLGPDESIRLVEQLYGSVLAMDVMLAGEPDETRKSLILGHLQNTTITRDGGKIEIVYPTGKERPAETDARPERTAPAQTAPPTEIAVETATVTPTHPEPAAETPVSPPKLRAPRAPRAPRAAARPAEPAPPQEAPAED